MKLRERFVNTVLFKDVDRVPIWEFLGYWPDTIRKWYSEGLPYYVGGPMPLYEYLDLDPCPFWNFLIPLDFGPIPRFVSKTLEEDERYRICISSEGIKMKILKKGASMPTFLEHPVRNREDWERYKERFDPHDPRRYPLDWSEELIEVLNERSEPVGLWFTSFFGLARNLMGLKRALIAFVRDHEFLKEIFDFWTEFYFEVTKDVVKNVKVDFLYMWEDMAYNKGPHISPKTFRDVILPYYIKVISHFKHYGVQVFIVDSDGNVDLLIPLFIEAGVNLILPLEVNAGMDVIELREKYGKRIAFIGNINKVALKEGKESIDKELERKLPLVKEGGFIPCVDHGVPLDVPLKNYLYYINQLKDRLKQE